MLSPLRMRSTFVPAKLPVPTAPAGPIRTSMGTLWPCAETVPLTCTDVAEVAAWLASVTMVVADFPDSPLLPPQPASANDAATHAVVARANFARILMDVSVAMLARLCQGHLALLQRLNAPGTFVCALDADVLRSS